MTYCLCSWPAKKYQYICPPPLPKAKKDHDDGEAGALTGEDYDLMLHFAIGHMRRLDGALPDFDDGEKLLDFFAGIGKHR